MAMEKKSLGNKKVVVVPAPTKKKSTAKAKVDTSRPEASKVVAALKVGLY